MPKPEINPRLQPGGCYCDELRKDGTCKHCGAKNVRITIPGLTVGMIREVVDYVKQIDRMNKK